LRRQLLAPEIVAELNGHNPERLVWESHGSAPADDALGGMIAADVATVLPDDFLVKVDRASMAHGLEVRPPLLDHELLELAGRIPSRWKVHEGETKWIAKKAFAGRLPASVVSRAKHGFEIPIDAWLRGPLREVFELSVLQPRARVRDFVNQTIARKLYNAHRLGLGQHGSLLWSLLILARWTEHYVGAAAV
jgi:asparagine synthase (glutamine-hydrolysing)